MSGYCRATVHESKANIQPAGPEKHVHRSRFGRGVGDSGGDAILSIQVDALHWTSGSRLCSQGGSAWKGCLHRWTGYYHFFSLFIILLFF